MVLSQREATEVLLGLGRAEQSILFSLGLKPTIAGSLVHKAKALLDLGKFREAEALIVDLRDLVGVGHELSVWLAQARKALGDRQGAAVAYDEALRRLAPEHAHMKDELQTARDSVSPVHSPGQEDCLHDHI